MRVFCSLGLSLALVAAASAQATRPAVMSGG